MGIDVDPLALPIARFRQRLHHGSCAALGFRVGGGDVVGIAGGAVATDLAVDFRTPGLGVLVFFQHQRTGALTDDKAAPTGIEGQGSGVGILRRGQGLHVDKARNAHGDDGGFRAAGNHCVCIAVTDEPQSLADGVRAGCAGGDSRQGRALAVVANGDHARGHIGDHHGHAQRTDPVRAPAFQLADLGGHGVQAADAGAEVHRNPLGSHGANHTAFLHGLHRRAHGVLGEAVRAQGFALFHIGQGIKILYLGTQLGLVIGGIKIGDGADAIAAGHQVAPSRLHVAADGADNAHAGDDHTSIFVH